jgi:hypothetical protein
MAKTEVSIDKKWTDYAEKHLVGRTIAQVRYMSEEETKDMGWYKRPLVISLDDGTMLFPSMDDEGNDGGALFGQNKDREDLTFGVI